MSIIRKHKQQGVFIIELLIGILVGIIVIAGSISAFIAISSSNRNTLETTRLVHELRTALSLIVHDSRRAGYFGQALNDMDTGTNTNPFMTAQTDIQTPTANCLLFSYDLNNDGVLPALNNAGGDERYGYRLNNSTIETRAIADPSFACDQGTWDALTNSNSVEITNLAFTLTPTAIDLDGAGPVTSTINIRNLTISMSGRLAQDNTVVRTLTETVRIRNDKFIP